MKTCKKCNIEKTTENFPWHSNHRRRLACIKCESAARALRGYKPQNLSLESKQRRCERAKVQQKLKRANPAYLASIILTDTRNADRKKGFENDLSKDIIEAIIANGCSYCRHHSRRMTVDRIDNSKGHTTTNVVSACYRCNMIRGNMPYLAWLNMVPALQDTVEKGLLDGWQGFGPWAGLRDLSNDD